MTENCESKQAEESPEQKNKSSRWSKEEQRHFFEIALCFVFLAYDVIEWWPKSHFWSLLSAIVLLSFFALIEMPRRFGVASTIVLVISGSIGYFLAGPIPPPPLPPPQIGWLQPANEATPTTSCDNIPAQFKAAGSALVIVGDTGFIPPNPFQDWTAIELGQCYPLTLHRDENGISVSADVYSTTGEPLGQIRNNRYNISGANNLIVERTGDLSSLVVHDEQGHELLFVRYVNPNTIRIRGIFTCPSPRLETVTATNTSLTIPGNNVFHGACLSGGRSGVKIE
jgi:hypothetical protein